MTVEDPPGALAPPAPPLTATGTGQWTASRNADVRAVLSDVRFEVAEAGPGGPAGTLSWLRAAVSRFANGAEHRRRRELVTAELRRLGPEGLRSAAYRRTLGELAGAGGPGDLIDVMGRLARRVPMAVLAASLGIADPEQAAAAVAEVAGGYFPGASAAATSRADTATAWLAGALAPADLDVVVARISLLVQGCDATAGLIGTALHLLQDSEGEGAAWTTDAVLGETARHSPPVRASRRVAAAAADGVAAADAAGGQIGAGDLVVCDIEAASRDSAVYDRPELFDPSRRAEPILTFGFGIRPCPGPAQALALAAGVVDAVRERCGFRPGTAVAYEPSAALRIPQRLELVLR
jgi:cytochrome P450